mgnify:CR=1 FL=1
MTMAASHRGLWYEGKPSNIGRDTIADSGELGGYNDGRKGRKAAAAAARMALQSGTEENIMPRHQPPSPTDGLGIRHTHGDMGQRRGKEGVLIVEEWGGKQRMGPLGRLPIWERKAARMA